MITQIEKDLAFQAAVHFDGEFTINLYDITLSISIETESIREQNVAMDRAVYFIMGVMQNTVIINSSEVQAIENYKLAGLKVCEVPEDPYDQIIALVLISKLNAIMEGKLFVTDLQLSSTLGESVRFNISSDVAETILAGNFWWNKATTCINYEESIEYDGNVLKLFDDSSWAEMGLTWKECTKK